VDAAEPAINLARIAAFAAVEDAPAGVGERDVLFVDALHQRMRSVGEAVDQSISQAAEFDLTGCFETLISADITVGLESDDSRRLSTT